MPKIQLRHDTATNWTTYNPVLLEGECGVETDTNKFKFGDGTTAWNSLDYAGGGDLTNYYNKSETDGLLDEKQDRLSPNPPLTITEYTKNNLEGFVYTPDNLGLRTAGISDTSKAFTTRWTSGQTSTLEIESYTNGTFTDSQDKDNLWSSGYIDIPYTFGQVVGGGKCAYSKSWSDCNIIFGKFVNEEFVPITYPLYIGSSGCYVQVSISDTFSYSLGTNRCSMYQTSVPVYGGSSYGTQTSISTALESERAYGSLCQLVDTGSTIKVNVGYGENFASYNGNDLIPSSYSRLKEITTARIVQPYGINGDIMTSPLLIDGIGLYNYEGEITATTFVTTDVLGENLFDIGGETKQTYLDLHIGSGLSIDGSGNLVNSNPTPYDLPTASTSTLGGVKVDGTTITIDSNGVISSSGGSGGESYDYIAGDGITITDVSTSTLENNMTSGSQNVNASSYESGYDPYYAFDGNSSTYWGPSSAPSSGSPCWIERIHDPIKVTQVNITFRESSEVFVSGSIFGSNDGTNYTEIGAWNNNSGLSLSVKCEPSTTYTYTRIESEEANGGWGKVGEITIAYQNYSTPTKEVSADVDQTYDGTSSNAQSGIAVAEALSSFTITNINGGNA